jgi:probable addiction module antidote protein
MTFNPKKWDIAERLYNKKFISKYLKIAFDSGNISDITRVRKMTELTTKIGITYQEFYKTFSENGNSEFATIQKLIIFLSLQAIIITPVKPVENTFQARNSNE